MAKTLRLEDYTVLLLCPLVIEQQAAYLMLDEVHSTVPQRSAGQTVLYHLGRISSSNVAIAGYPAGEVGIGISGSMVAEAQRDFINLEAAFLVGIAAGIPSPTRDIRLGDVAVAVPTDNHPGVIGYDLAKVEDDQVRLKQWQNSTLPLLRSAISYTEVRAVSPGEGFTRHLHVWEKATMFKRPGPPPTSGEWFTNMHLRNNDEPQVHYGTILSGNGVIKSKRRRDELRDKYDGIAIEMEAAGMMTRLPVAIVRGISDFADSKKHDGWQRYAALTAAAYTKEIVIALGSRKVTESGTQSVISSKANTHLSRTLPKQCSFIGRERELVELEGWLNLHRQNPLQQSVITLWGLSGVGKSQLVSEFVKRQRHKHPDYDIFWATGESKEAFEQSIISACKAATGPITTSPEIYEDNHTQRAELISLFFAELEGPKRDRWLLVIDGVSGISSFQESIRGYMDRLSSGAIILTARNKEVAEWYPTRMEVKGLPNQDAVKLLQLEIDEPFRGRAEDVLELAKMLKGLPLSLKLAASVISNHHLTVARYAQKWKKRELDDESLSADPALLRSFEVSFEELEHTSPLATKLLMLFAFLDHRDMWYNLCLNADDSEYPNWLREMANQKFFLECCNRMHKLSFIEIKLNNEEKCIYEIHPAIHEFCRGRAKPNQEEFVKYAVSLVAAHVPRSTDRDFLNILRRLEPHADQCKIHMEQGRGGRGLDLLELEQFGNLFRLVGRYEEASRFYEGILNVLRRDEPSPWALELMANIENNLGLVYHARRKYDLALQAFDRSSQWSAQLPVQDEDAVMSTLYNRGRAFMMLSELGKAQQCLVNAANYFSISTTGVDNHLEREGKMRFFFRILNDLGEINLRNNKLDEAEQKFREAFDGQKQYLHELHPATFAVRLNMGRLCVERHRFASARQIFAYIVATYTKWWGRRHPETMRAVDELANSYMQHGKLKHLMGDDGDPELKMAAALWTETRSFYQEIYGPDSDVTKLVAEKLQSLNMVCEDLFKIFYSTRLP